MRKQAICIFTLLFFAISVNAEITQEQALLIIYANIDTTNVDIYISKNRLDARQSLQTVVDTLVSPSYQSWLIFIDEHPFANWSHACKYIFVNVDNGTYDVFNRNVPPLSYDGLLVIKQMTFPFEPAGNTDLNIKNNTKSVSRVGGTPCSYNNYAVIISGGGSMENNHVRYWNDCSFIYKTLVNDYNYDRSHIYVLMSDGTNPANDRKWPNGTYDSSPLDLDDDGIPDIQYAATKSNLWLVFNELSNVLTQENDLFIYTTDHGYILNSHSLLNLWGESIYDYEFANLLSNINAHTISVVMGQCNSGGFIDDLSAANRVVMTACTANQSSWSMNNLYYDEFVYHWTSAMAKKTPSGNSVNADANSDGCISMEEAFLYAKNNDTQNETPQYNSNPVVLGRQTFLNRFISLQGPSQFCDTAVYTLENVPSGATITWKNYNILQPTDYPYSIKSGQGTSRVVYKRGKKGTNRLHPNFVSLDYTGSAIVSATISFAGKSYTVTKSVYIGNIAPKIALYDSLGYHMVPSSAGTAYRMVVVNCADVPDNDIHWVVSSSAQEFETLGLGRYFPIRISEPQVVTAEVSYTTESCGLSSTTQTYSFTLPSGMLSTPLVYQNPVSIGGTLDVFVTQTSNSVAALQSSRSACYTLELWSELYGRVRMVNADEPTTQISLSGLPAGTYFIKLIIDNELVTTKQLIIK